MRGKKSILVQVSNASDVDYELELVKKNADFSAPEKFTLAGRKTVLLQLSGKAGTKTASEFSLDYRVTNLLTGPDQSLAVTLPIKVKVQPSGN